MLLQRGVSATGAPRFARRLSRSSSVSSKEAVKTKQEIVFVEELRQLLGHHDVDLQPEEACLKKKKSKTNHIQKLPTGIHKLRSLRSNELGQPILPPSRPVTAETRVLLFERFLYNMQKYRGRNHLEVSKRVRQFQHRWIMIRPCVYNVKDHRLNCLNRAAWPTGLKDQSIGHSRKPLKCFCNEKKAVSFWLPPFQLRLVEKPRLLSTKESEPMTFFESVLGSNSFDSVSSSFQEDSRPINPSLFLETKSCKNLKGPLPVVLFLGGKDMLALRWLDVVSAWLQQSVLKLKPKPKEDGRRLSTVRNVPKWDAEAALRQRRPSARIQAEQLAKQLDKPPKKEGLNASYKATVQSAFACRIEAAIALVEYPGYGMSEGQASPNGCVDSTLKALRTILSRLKTPDEGAELHIVGYSLGAAVALRVATLIAEMMLKGKSNCCCLKSVILIAPFSSTVECANSILKIPRQLHSISKALLSALSNSSSHFDNTVAIGQLATLLASSMKNFFEIIECSADIQLFEGLRLTILFGSNDEVVAPTMGPSLASKARHILGASERERVLVNVRGL